MMSKYAIRASSVGIRCLSNYSVAPSSNSRTNVNTFDKKMCFLSGAGASALMIQRTQPQFRHMSSSIIDEINKAKQEEAEKKKAQGLQTHAKMAENQLLGHWCSYGCSLHWKWR